MFAMELSILIYFLLTVVTLIYCYFKFKYSYWRKRRVPYIEPVIPFGNMLPGNSRLHMSERLGELYYQLKGKQSFAGIYIFQRPAVLATDLDFIKTILIKDFNCFQDRGMYVNVRDDPLTGNLFMVDGPQWKNLRTTLTPTFTSGKIKFMFPTIVEVAGRFQATLRDLISDDSEIELREILARYTTDVIGSCAFGIECNSLKDPNSQFRLMGKKVFDTPRNGLLKRIFMTTCKEWAKSLRMKHFRDDITEFFMNVVRETIDMRKEKNIRRNDFIDLMMQLMYEGKLNDHPESAVGKLTFEQVVAQAFTFFAAGFETSSTTMSYTLFELALHQDIQDKARKVINETLKKYDGKLTYECIMEMTYIDQIMNESLRKYPPGGILFRLARDNYKVPGTEKIINKGTMVLVPVYGIHHDPDYYPNPANYDPDRFAPGVQRNHFTFLPFGEGPRNCIGLRFGTMQARVGIVMLLMNFKITACAKTTNPLEFCKSKGILTPKDGLWLHVEPV